ncbi:hypothetical protein BX285_6905 [Streptomyces sp. 1114.5]|uniref:hypothetical protein n=1 Tax=unclassified Streptomyces TaxID=2593676 RepID=UPI000BD8F4E8|nr:MULTISPECIES: hypothetical protein [unclassified Streptomyces]RKT09799.1 hypothetical protein BX285_6905 [Streptomyces sp. 1114.5]SOB88850.1 hypothetical protein SAMN06272789_7170 [Streptomyces sp. 1331.2]
MKTLETQRKPDRYLPALAPPVRRDDQAGAGRRAGGPGVEASRSACAGLTGPARSMCYAAL